MNLVSKIVNLTLYIMIIMLCCTFLDGLIISEVAAVLEDYMIDCFNTDMRDGSAAEVAEVLVKFYQYCIEDKASIAMTELEKLPPLQSWFLSLQPVQQNHSAMNCDSSSNSNEGMNTNNMDMNTDEGWTMAKDRRRR